MKYSISTLLILSVLIFGFSCEEECFDPQMEGEVTTWLQTEYGYSPGAGYIVEKVPSTPARTLSLNDDGTCSSNIDDLKNYSYYLILDDPNSEQDIIAFYTNQPNESDRDIENLEHSYNMIKGSESLRLNFRFCFEGCHLGFVKK